MNEGKIQTVLVACVLMAVVLPASWAVLSRDAAVVEADVQNRPIEVAADGYVTSRTCRACHPGQYGTWRRSYHSTMTQVATPKAVVPEMHEIELSLWGETYYFERRGDEFWVRHAGPGLDTVERRVVMTTGSHHFQAYWSETGAGRRLDLLPFAYDIKDARWIPFAAIPVSPPGIRHTVGIARTWNRNCIMCHSTAYLPREGAAGMDTHVRELGISCEACHGPALEHVEGLDNPISRYARRLAEDPDPTIVNPARVDHRTSTEICGQCHAVYEFRGRQKSDWYRQGAGYRPGVGSVEDTRTLVIEDPPQRIAGFEAHFFWDDGVVRLNGREYNSLLRTPCFQAGEMSCLSCHAMHQSPGDPRSMDTWADDMLKPDMRGVRACVQCHLEFGEQRVQTEHSRHAADSPGNECMNCHMPHTAWGLQKATRVHEVASPSVAESVSTGRPNACNLCHLDKPLAWTAAKLEQWYGQESPALSEDQRSIAAGVLWVMEGDAGQRALISWHMGWQPAQRASGTDWMSAYLARQLLDPYDTTRAVAVRSLRTLPGFGAFDVDFMASVEERRAAADRVTSMRASLGRLPSPADPQAVLVSPEGIPRAGELQRLLRKRDNTLIYLQE
jgi:hypothetical protein